MVVSLRQFGLNRLLLYPMSVLKEITIPESKCYHMCMNSTGDLAAGPMTVLGSYVTIIKGFPTGISSPKTIPTVSIHGSAFPRVCVGVKSRLRLNMQRGLHDPVISHITRLVTRSHQSRSDNPDAGIILIRSTPIRTNITFPHLHRLDKIRLSA